MSTNDPNYREPKTTNVETSSGGIGKWIGIALAVLLGLLILGWLFGFFASDADMATVDGDTETVVVEEPVVNETTETDAVVVPEGETVTPETAEPVEGTVEPVTPTEDAATNDAATDGAATDGAATDDDSTTTTTTVPVQPLEENATETDVNN